MKVTERVALEILHHESLVRQAYKDSVGVWTWSAGITSKSGHKVERYINKPQPLMRCLEVYIWLLREKYAPAVRRAFNGVELTEAQFAAALSFHWNTGAIESATWVKQFVAGDEGKARKSIMNWRKPPEIIDRRRAERDLFFFDQWSGDGKTTEYTRVKSNGIPDWSSAKRVSIRKHIGQILGAVTVVNDTSGEPPVRPDNPNPAPPQPDRFAALKAWFTRIFGG